ncbi:hypothetical protein CKO11_14445, partial [Rhodobacter sp. TJ_12]|nr:hypothetical protein [Rhodobacter sp. TJ_12]
MKVWLALPLIWLAAPALAAPFALSLPQGAALSAERTAAATSYDMRIGPWNPQAPPTQTVEGLRTDRAWRLRGNQETSLQIFAPLRAQIEAAGYALIYQCETDACGGFDFRYALDLIPEPEMHVDLGDFRYLAARKGDGWLALTVSRSSESGFVHLTRITAQEIAAPAPADILAPPPP